MNWKTFSGDIGLGLNMYFSAKGWNSVKSFVELFGSVQSILNLFPITDFIIKYLTDPHMSMVNGATDFRRT